MKKSSKFSLIITISALFIFTIIASYKIGVKQGIQYGRTSSSIGGLIRLEQQITEQMENANCDGLKKALINYLVLIENYKEDEDLTIRKYLYHQHKMIANLVIAKIEEREGEGQKALRHLELAKEACVDRNWDDCTTERLDQYAKDYIKEHQIACLKNIE